MTLPDHCPLHWTAGHSFVVDTSFVNLGSCRRCGMIKTHAGEWGCEDGIFKCANCCNMSGNKYYDPLGDNRLTLDYIYKNASDEELEAIVHSITNRLFADSKHYYMIDRDRLTDKYIAEFVKGLRKPQ